MFVHLGSDVVIPVKEIIAIIDMSLVESSEITAEFFKVAKEEEFVKDISGSEGSGKSMVITPKTIYISPISSLTLKGRAEGDLTQFDE